MTRILLSTFCVLCAAVSLHGQTTILNISPANGVSIQSPNPVIQIDFSAPIIAPADAIRLYRVGSDPVTPSSDDLRIQLSGVSLENGNTRAVVSPLAPMPEGEYALVIYGTGTTTSGPVRAVRFTFDMISLDLTPFLSLTEFTIEGWTYWHSLPQSGFNSFGALFDVGQNDRNVPGFWLSHATGDDLRFGCINENLVQTEVTANNQLIANTWIHLAATSGADGMKLYVNGELVGHQPTPCVPANASAAYNIALSGYSRWAGANDYVNATFDEMRVWNIARSQSQIAAAMNTPLDGSEPGLIVYHRLDGVISDELVDYTGNGYSGSLNGAARVSSDAPLINMSIERVTNTLGDGVDVDVDGVAGGVLVSPFFVDLTPPRVLKTNIGFNGCSTTLGFDTIVVSFDDAMNPATIVPGNVSLKRSNADGILDNGNDLSLAVVGTTYDVNPRTATIQIGSLRPDDLYRLTISDAVTNVLDVPLDGELPGEAGPDAPFPSGNGIAGGNLVFEFVVDSSPDCNANGIADACDLYPHGLAFDQASGPSGMRVYGGAVDNGDRLRVVASSGQQSGAAWSEEKQYVTAGFECEFTFNLNPGATGGEGIAFVIQNFAENALGSGGASLGYSGIPKSIAVEFDTVGNSNDLPDNHISIQSNGANPNSFQSSASLGWTTAMVELADGQNHTVQIVYYGRVLTLYFDGNPIPILEVEADIGGLLSLTDGYAWIGFTAATGTAAQNHDVLSFSFTAQSNDCNNDLIPDECQLLGNDCNSDGIPDECQLEMNDVNGNGVPDDCDIDCDNDGIPDDFQIANCQIGDMTCVDCNENGELDACELYVGGMPPASAIQSPINGHHYMLTTSMNWNSAETFAQSLGGHLATIRSAEEDDWIYSTFGPLASGADLLMGYNDVASESLWVWVSGETANYENWFPGEPNNNGGNEDYGAVFASNGEWNDVRSNFVGRGVIEISPMGDCNENGILDECDINNLTSIDCNANGVPDECEPGGIADCDNDDESDLCELFNGAIDCNSDTIPDECQLQFNDCDSNGVPDDCEPDCDGNMIPDACDIANCQPGDPSCSDCNANGELDVCELSAEGMPPPQAIRSPINGNYYLLTNSMTWMAAESLAQTYGGHLATIRSLEENAWILTTFAPLTTSTDILMGYNDIESEGVWVWASNEEIAFENWLSGEPNNASNEDIGVIIRSSGLWNDRPVSFGAPAVIEISPLLDCNENGILDECDIDNMTSVDCNANGLPDECEPGGDSDCDNDGESNLCELLQGGLDCNGDIIPDDCQLEFNDCNANGIPDDCDPDCDGNMIPDDCDIATCPTADLSCSDCNNNGIPDGCETRQLVANSPSEFSGLQGQSNWLYGYYVAPFTSDNFIEMTQYLSSSPDFGEPTWHVQQGSGGFYTGISASRTIGNAGALNGRQGIEHWSARRWIAEYDSASTLTGHIAKVPEFAGGCGGCDGSTAHIFVDGVEVWSFALAQTDAVGTSFNVDVNLVAGSTVDFVYDPNGYVGQDRAIFTASILGATDCNENGVLDECDISDMASDDCNLNGVPDECEIIDTFDCDNDGVSDICELLIGDCNDDGIPDDCQLDGNDCDNNGIPDECQPDCDGDGIPDACEFGSEDCDNNGIPDECQPDCDNNGIPDACEIINGDCDSDGIPDSCETDCNNNQIPDECENLTPMNGDCNRNGIPDECEEGGATDCNNDGISDLCEVVGGAEDCDGNSVPDECELAERDCNANLIVDTCELVSESPSLRFDGTEDSAVIPLMPSYSFNQSSTFTIELWVGGITSVTGTDSILEKWNGSPSTSYPFALRITNDGRFVFQTKTVSGHLDEAVSHQGFNDDQWHHVAAVRDGLNEMRLYVDGVLVGSDTNLSSEVAFNNVSLTLGKQGSLSLGYLACELAELRIWNIVRDQAEIAETMNQQLPGSTPNIVGYWPMNDGVGQIFQNIVPGGIRGVLGNSIGFEPQDPTWVLSNVPLGLLDCNANGVPDNCDTEFGASTDCNSNQIPDECEVSELFDCDDDGISNFCEIIGGAIDCNADLIPDECQLITGDCNANGILDECEPGFSNDCNSNGTPDFCEIATGQADDCNNNEIPDLCDLSTATSSDVNSNLIPDDCELDVRVMPVIRLSNPFSTPSVVNELPTSISSVLQGSTIYVEIWASDVGSSNSGLSGVYVDAMFQGEATVLSIEHESDFDFLALGTSIPGGIDEFGGTYFGATPLGVEPTWSRVGWIELLLADLDFSVSLAPSLNGIVTQNGGVMNAFLELGFAEVMVQTPIISYDLTGDDFVGVNDLVTFLSAWMQNVPPASAAFDFDCDDHVGPGDFSWFATAWQKMDDDLTIQYPPCALDNGQPLPIELNDIEVRLIPLTTPSIADEAIMPPDPHRFIAAGSSYVVEIWATDHEPMGTGISSIYIDASYSSSTVTLSSLSVNSELNIKATGSDDGMGSISQLGGSQISSVIGSSPSWIRVATISANASMAASIAEFEISAADSIVASYGRGLIDELAIQNAIIVQGVKGDLDLDGDYDEVDIDLFVGVVLGFDTDVTRRILADLNADGTPDGGDIQELISLIP